MRALEVFCMYTKLSINSSEIKITLVKSQIKIIVYYEPLETVERFKYLGHEAPSNNKWKEHATHASRKEIL